MKIVGLMLILGLFFYLHSLPDDRSQGSTSVVARPALPGRSAIPVAVSEEALGELVNAFREPDWIAALEASGAAFQVPSGARLVILDSDHVRWSLQHPAHTGVALKVRVIDADPLTGKNIGRVGYVLSEWLDASGFRDRFAEREPASNDLHALIKTAPPIKGQSEGLKTDTPALRRASSDPRQKTTGREAPGPFYRIVAATEARWLGYQK